ncbi:hypothetical protein [Nostoc sp. TCL26-01]|uniref:hypothetical protein n=1 Tax=Nostoc sp. TCL26-01 TaxID=2576904 RepID=UPI0015BA14C8|nr:hypothetical protein [Nostoc sp. TCL26-01]QLE58564.1 hypothetical protein FD725_25490 [Nostoc sp. TCL26-01]
MTSNILLQRIHQHQYLSNLRNKLLRLHKVLLDAERITYEQVRGRVSSGEFLQLVIGHEQFAWLHCISELVVQIDEILAADEPLSIDSVKALTAHIRTLLSPSEEGNTFARKYYTALQDEPSVVLAHADVSQLLAVK